MVSRAIGREGHCRQMSPACVGSTCSGPVTLGLPLLKGVCFPRLHCSGSQMFCMEWAFHYRAVPAFRYSTKARTRLGLCFMPSPARAAQAARSLTSALSLGVVRLLTSAVPVSLSMGTSRVCAPCVCSPELASSHDPSSTCQPPKISGSRWLETGSQVAVW